MYFYLYICLAAFSDINEQAIPNPAFNFPNNDIETTGDLTNMNTTDTAGEFVTNVTTESATEIIPEVLPEISTETPIETPTETPTNDNSGSIEPSPSTPIQVITQKEIDEKWDAVILPEFINLMCERGFSEYKDVLTYKMGILYNEIVSEIRHLRKFRDRYDSDMAKYIIEQRCDFWRRINEIIKFNFPAFDFNDSSLNRSNVFLVLFSDYNATRFDFGNFDEKLLKMIISDIKSRNSELNDLKSRHHQDIDAVMGCESSNTELCTISKEYFGYHDNFMGFFMQDLMSTFKDVEMDKLNMLLSNVEDVYRNQRLECYHFFDNCIE